MIGLRKFRTSTGKKQERTRVLIRLVGGTFVITCCIALLVYASHQPYARVRNVLIQYDGTINVQNIEATVSDVLRSSTYFLLPYDSLLLPHSRRITSALMNEFPRIRAVHVTRVRIQDIVVRVEERRPTALWCGDVVPPIALAEIREQEQAPESLWGTCYLMDEQSYIYAKAPLYTGTMYSRYYGSLDQATPVGQRFADDKAFETWQAFITSMTLENDDVVAFLVTDEHDIELFLEGGLKLLLPRDNMETAYARFVALRDSEEFGDKASIEYVDLRFDTKAFIKRKSLEPVDA